MGTTAIKDWKTSVKPRQIRRAIVDLAYSRLDPVYLYGTFNAISRKKIRINNKTFANGYLAKLKEEGLVERQPKGKTKLTEAGSFIQRYITNSKKMIEQAGAQGFGNDLLYLLLHDLAPVQGTTKKNLKAVGFIKEVNNNLQLTRMGQQVHAYLNALERAKWTRAGKPERAPKLI